MHLSLGSLWFTLALIPKTLSICLQAPAGKLSSGCSIGNLTLVSNYGNVLINASQCNATVDQSFVNSMPRQIGFTKHFNVSRTYLITAVDLTSREPLWMISNATVKGSNVFPSSNVNTQTILHYRGPKFNATSRHHLIEFLVFAEFRANYTSSYYLLNPASFRPPFNLLHWIQTQQNSGLTICGPVAGGSVIAYQQPAKQFNDNGYSPPANNFNPSHHQHNHKIKNNAFQLNFSNKSLISLLVFYTYAVY